ncbi:hypothetical protein D6C84_10448 [Aureobasidium pullulans]|uniref:SGF29 C-terminal domain-containing protein n=1 Tax=Aureobasidium pullulans TaxID=5580 RepID=A0A4S9HJ53_AURPU|nr:hypothetical protein JADG_001892 [Aureobasidium pullulans]THV65813.1 hypothetical protein D6D29_10500 [Aureobasidium pullulans]THV69524.1 hypothetical protein D6D28_05841 [Aureobasidium pullulans]THW11685.1 hypothetical protein D6D24_07059 [Aureobasidium pullulans]THW41444.1 hypothetical protein D6D21_06344 [Aureobasidium pullulans]
MSSRNRQPRASLNQDADEERRLWNTIKERSKKVDTMMARCAVIGTEIVDVEKQQAALIEAGELSDMRLDERLESLYRENVKLSEDISHIVDGNSDEMSLLDSIKVLAGLREASEESLNLSRSHSNSKGRNATLKKKAGSMDVDDEASVVSSPRPGGRQANEPRGSRLQLNLGAQVFYRNKGRTQEGEGILCRVTNVIGEGKQRRYEIQDAEPEPLPDGEFPPPYRASVAHLMPIPTKNDGLADLNKGRNVLAQYPDTTTFYKAEVMENWRSKDLSDTSDGSHLVHLSFEGDDGNNTQVERRFVLAEKEK